MNIEDINNLKKNYEPCGDLITILHKHVNAENKLADYNKDTEYFSLEEIYCVIKDKIISKITDKIKYKYTEEYNNIKEYNNTFYVIELKENMVYTSFYFVMDVSKYNELIKYDKFHICITNYENVLYNSNYVKLIMQLHAEDKKIIYETMDNRDIVKIPIPYNLLNMLSHIKELRFHIANVNINDVELYYDAYILDNTFNYADYNNIIYYTYNFYEITEAKLYISGYCIGLYINTSMELKDNDIISLLCGGNEYILSWKRVICNKLYLYEISFTSPHNTIYDSITDIINFSKIDYDVEFVIKSYNGCKQINSEVKINNILLKTIMLGKYISGSYQCRIFRNLFFD